MRRGRHSRAAAVLVLGLLGGCAASLSGGRDHQGVAGAAGAGDGWTALSEGRDADAEIAFQLALRRDPGDRLALFGRAALAFERGDGGVALSSYLAVLERAVDVRSDGGGPDLGALSSMSAGRVTVLLDEFGGGEAQRRVLEDRLLALPLAGLPWEARHDLALLSDDIVRRRGAPALLAQVAVAAGCVRAFRVGRPAGALPHLDLDAPLAWPAPDAGGGRDVRTVGCAVAMPSADGRAGAQRVFADVQVPADGVYDLVLDFREEARLRVDGGPLIPHGGETQYGPRVSATRLRLARGRHRIELRLATFGGHPELTMMIVPAAVSPATTAPSAARLGARPTGFAAAGGAASASASMPVSVSAPVEDALPKDPVALALEFAATYVANRRGAATRAWQGARRLESAHRFAVGLALAAAIARDDPSMPSGFTRDRARSLLRATLAADATLARPRHALAAIALDDERPREAIDEALAATRAAPGWWFPQLTLHAAYRQRGLTWDADRALDRAMVLGAGACPVIEAALGRAEDRHRVGEETRLAAALGACGKDSDQQIERMRRLGDLAGAAAALRRTLAMRPDRSDDRMNLAGVLVARGQAAEAADLIASTVTSGDSEGRLRLADALLVAGRRAEGRATVAALLAEHPESPDLLRAARVLGLALPLDPFRLDGRKVIRDFQAAGRRYAAPAVVVLDRTVTRVFPSGAEMVLTHEIVRVQSKDAVQKWGEIAVPERTEILTLRTHKADGTTREPEELAGKDSISAADLAIGDCVEKETLETRAPRDAFLRAGVPTGEDQANPAANASRSPRPGQGGYLGDRFYFQSFDAPLDRSEYLVITSRDLADRMHVDQRAGAPAATRAPVPAPAVPAADGGGAAEALVVTTFSAAHVAQLFAERSSVSPIEHVPSVRVSAGVGWLPWTRFLREQLYGTVRAAPALDRAAAEIRALAPGGAPAARAAALLAWVGQYVEADDDLRDPASFGVARGRGNRLAVVLALARALGLPARPVLARSRLTADGEAVAPLEEADDFADALVRFELPGGPAFYADPRLKHAPLGYLPPGLDGARVLLLDGGSFDVAHSLTGDHRSVDVALRLNPQGGGVAEATETVRGWPALEWAEIVDRFGTDPTKLRQDFEQRWLGVHFPGAVLKDLRIDILATAGSGPPARLDPPADDVVAGGAEDHTAAQAPGIPYAASEVRLRYSFRSARLAVKRDGELRLQPTFFRSQPGRRYATEPRRATALLTGFDVPLDLQARIELPPGAHLLAVPRAATSAVRPPAAASPPPASGPGIDPGAVVLGPAGCRFYEERHLDAGASVPAAAPASPVLVLRRQARLPIMRVSPAEYPSLAAALRRVDALEQEEVRIGVGPEAP